MKRMTTGQKAVSFLGAAVPSFADTYFRARGLANQEQAAAAEQALGRGRLGIQQQQVGIDLANTGLRAGELEERVAARGSAEERAAARNRIDVWKAASGGMAPNNPGGYASALSADPNSFADALQAAHGVALANQQRQAGRLAGTRAGAEAAAKSTQRASDNERIRLTEQYRREGTLDQAVAQGFKPFTAAPRNAGQDLEELRAATGIRQLGKTMAHARQLSKAQQMVPQAVALQAAKEQLSLDPESKKAFEAADIETQAEMLKQIVGSYIGFENIAPE